MSNDGKSGRQVGLWTDRKGATEVEYALLAGVIGIALIVGLQSLGGSLNQTFD
jgi:Flp pilus assembly pilin Flp